MTSNQRIIEIYKNSMNGNINANGYVPKLPLGRQNLDLFVPKQKMERANGKSFTQIYNENIGRLEGRKSAERQIEQRPNEERQIEQRPIEDAH